MHGNASVVLKLHVLPLEGRQCLTFVSLLIFFFIINLLWSSFIIFLWSYILGKCLFLFFCFSTTWSLLLCICKYVLQSNVKLMVPWWKYIFQRVLVPSVGCLLLLLYFFGLLPERLWWGPCWWWFTRNIRPKARVACIFCYGLTHLCQTHCSGAVSNLKFLLFMLSCKVLTTQVLTCSLV